MRQLVDIVTCREAFVKIVRETLKDDKDGRNASIIVSAFDHLPVAYNVDDVVSEICRRGVSGYRDVDGKFVPTMISVCDAVEVVKSGYMENKRG